MVHEAVRIELLNGSKGLRNYHRLPDPTGNTERHSMFEEELKLPAKEENLFTLKFLIRELMVGSDHLNDNHRKRRKSPSLRNERMPTYIN